MQSQPLKSVHITNYYHRNSGGISTSYNNLMAAAERHKRLVRLIVPGETESVEEVNKYSKIYFVPAKSSPLFDKRYRIIMPWQYMVKDSIIRQILLAEMPDMIEVTDKYTLSLLGVMVRTNNFKKLGRPMLVHFSCERMDDNVESFLTSGRMGKWFARRVIGNYTMPSFDYHIANSTYTAEEFFEATDAKANPRRSRRFFNMCWRFFKAPRLPYQDRIRVCPRGVDSVLFTPERKSGDVKREMLGLAGGSEKSVILLYAGRISPEKNIGLLVDMMRILASDTNHDFRMLVAGAGPQSNWLKQQTERHFPGKIVQLGHLEKEKLSDFYANADVFVHPNPHEPFGIAPLEAMAAGVPTLAPNAGGILSYATDENCWLRKPEAEDFAAAVREIISDDDIKNSKIRNALTTARNNSSEASTDRLFATYDEIYRDFLTRRELFTDVGKAKEFDYVEELLDNDQN